jgi:drug/metabolite transporter (DMT)-like permease
MFRCTVIRNYGFMLTAPHRPTHSGANRLRTAEHRSGVHWTLERVQIFANIGSALLFVVGCLGFYSERHQTSAVTTFLVGSVLFLVSAVGAAVAERDGMRPADRHPSSDPATNTPGASS